MFMFPIFFEISKVEKRNTKSIKSVQVKQLNASFEAYLGQKKGVLKAPLFIIIQFLQI